MEKLRRSDLKIFQQNQTVNAAVIIYVALAVLFQPFAKIALGRTVWNVADIIVANCLLLSIFYKPKQNG